MKLIFRLICKFRIHYFRIKRWEKYVYLSFILLATCGGVTEKVHLFFFQVSLLQSVGGLAAISSTCGVAKFLFILCFFDFAGFSWKNNDH